MAADRSNVRVAGPWSPLRIRVFRWLWIAGLVSNIGTFMHLVAAGWAMTSLTSSPLTISLVQTMWAIPGFLLALHAGAFADMIDRRRLIAATQVAALAVAAAVAVLHWTGHLGVGALLGGTFLESVALTLAAPAFMALTPDLVEVGRLPQAIGLDAISRNIGQSLGPAIAGAAIAAFGPGAVFMLNAVSFVGVLIVVLGYRPVHPAATASAPRWGELTVAIRQGMRHIIDTPQLRHIALRLTIVMAATSALQAVLPVVASANLEVSAGGFGLLTGAFGAGAVAAIQIMPFLRARLSLERIVLGSAALWAAGVMVLAHTHLLAVAVGSLVVAGVGSMAMLNVLFATFTVELPARVRGRGSSVAMLMVWLGASVGAVVWGLVASSAGVDGALRWAAVATVIGAICGRVLLPMETASAGDVAGSRVR